MMQLTFLNLTNGPNLNPAELKLVRGHVTKSNFARRRGLRGKNEQVDSQSRHMESAPEQPLIRSKGVKGGAIAVRSKSSPVLGRSMPEPETEIRFCT
jgi:hypothetical protein